MQGRLEVAKETQVASQKLLEDIKASIEAERSARKDTVCISATIYSISNLN